MTYDVFSGTLNPTHSLSAVWCCRQSVTEQQVILHRQEKEQQDKVTASVPDKKKLAELEKQVAHLKKGKKHYVHA